jgi:hypothetical protein
MPAGVTSTINASSYTDWDFQRYRLTKGVAGGQFINAESTLIASGPPAITVQTQGDTPVADGQVVFPIGLLETFGLQQSRQLQRIFEIGSSRSYFIPGRTVGSVTLGRTFYHGPSLLRALYSNYYGTMGNSEVPSILPGGGGQSLTRGMWRDPGHAEFFIDLASALFAQPTGMACYFKDSNTDTYGGFYLENNYVQGHQMTVSSGSVLIMEGASMQYDMLVPLNIKTDYDASGLSAAQQAEINP